MRTTASLRLSAINVVIVDPERHTPEAYERLFKDLAKAQAPIRARGEQYLEMDSHLTKTDDMLYGTLHRFTAIEAMNWYNTEKHRLASESELKQIRVPANIAANYREIPFALHLKSHTMVFVARSNRVLVSAPQVQMYIEKATAETHLFRKYGDVSATIEQDEQALDRILKSDGIKMLRIVVNRPNESFRKFDRTLYERMRDLRAKTLSEEFHSDGKDGLKPDEQIERDALVATSNGRVDAKVIVNGALEDMSTLNAPLQERVTYDTRKESVVEGFRRGVSQILDRIANKRKDE